MRFDSRFPTRWFAITMIVAFTIALLRWKLFFWHVGVGCGRWIGATARFRRYRKPCWLRSATSSILSADLFVC